MKHLCLSFTFIFCISSFGQNWQSLPNFSGVARDDAAGFVINNTAYFGSGLSPWWSEESDFHGFDLNSEMWFAISPLPTNKERQYATGFSSEDGRGFVFGGINNNNYLNDLWQYDPITDIWTELAPLPSVGRSGMANFVINDTAYFVGGKTDTNTAINEVWTFCMSTNVWTQRNNFPYGTRWRASASSLNDKGYLIFGKDDLGEFHNDLFEYDPYFDTWTYINNLPSLGRTHASLTALNGELYVCFGVDSIGNSHNDLWKYSVAANNWTNLPGLPALGRRGGVGLSWQNAIYYSTGIDESGTRLTETWKFVFDADIDEFNQNQNKRLIRIVDIMGRETELIPNVILFFLYENGTTEMVVIKE